MSENDKEHEDEGVLRVGPSGGGSISWAEHMETVRENNDLHERIRGLEAELAALRSQIDEAEHARRLMLPRRDVIIPEELGFIKPEDVIEVFIDGNGAGGYAALFPDHQLVEYLPRGATHNEAEWAALELALRFMNVDSTYLVKSDSNLVVQQVNKSWQIKEPRLQVFAMRCWDLMLHLNVEVMWIPREWNLADALLR